MYIEDIEAFLEGFMHFPGLNFKTHCFIIEEEAMLLLVFYYRIEDFHCRCCRFNLSLCRLLPFPVLHRCFKAMCVVG